jgi:acyl carrier protein
VDSFGILEMVSSIEQQFGIELDLANLDAEQMTILGSLARNVAEMAK